MSWQEDIAKRVRGEVRGEVPLAPKTSVRVGGAAELFVRPADPDDLVEILRFARERNVPTHVLGGGANTLVGDGGVPGVTLKLREERDRLTDLGDRMRLELSAGAPSARLTQLAREQGLLGVEWAAGIPGTVGGLTAMNAGTGTGEMKDRVTEVLLVGADGAAWRPASDLAFGYRHADLSGRVVARIRLELRKGDSEALRQSGSAQEKDLARRRATQPLSLPNSGSVFRNPPGEHAGRLIESCGLKGTAEGGAQISPVHANFIVNRGGATARDVTTLMARAQQAVQERFHLLLMPEVRLVGLFTPPPEALGLKA